MEREPLIIMVNITHKNYSLRKAIASAVVMVSRQETIDAIREGKVPKGNIFEFSRVAGLLAIKKTSDVIPDCHPLPVEFASITHEIVSLQIIITVEVHTIYKTGVEVEAMHGAAITALTIYDMLKPIDKAVEIRTIRLIEKEGGKSDALNSGDPSINCAVIVCSDAVSQGKAEDSAGITVVEKLKQFGINTAAYEVIPDEKDIIRSKAESLVNAKIDLIIFTGGTGLSPRDVTPEAIAPMIETPIPGIMEAFRHYGQDRMPYAMFSRGVAGFIKDSLIITMPGSVNAVNEAIDALFPQLLHVFKVREGSRHS